jgi:hypothetical protein
MAGSQIMHYLYIQCDTEHRQPPRAHLLPARQQRLDRRWDSQMVTAAIIPQITTIGAVSLIFASLATRRDPPRRRPCRASARASSAAGDSAKITRVAARAALTPAAPAWANRGRRRAHRTTRSPQRRGWSTGRPAGTPHSMLPPKGHRQQPAPTRAGAQTPSVPVPPGSPGRALPFL